MQHHVVVFSPNSPIIRTIYGMATSWDPRSYVTQAVASGPPRTVKLEETFQSYYEFTTNAIRDAEASKLAELTLMRQYENTSTANVSRAGHEVVFTSRHNISSVATDCVKDVIQTANMALEDLPLPGECGLFFSLVEQHATSLYTTLFPDKDVHRFWDQAALNKSNWQEFYFLHALAAKCRSSDLFPNSIVRCGDISFSLGDSWEVGMMFPSREVGTAEKYARLLSLPPFHASWQNQYTTGTGRQEVVTTLAIVSSDLPRLCALSIVCQECTSDRTQTIAFLRELVPFMEGEVEFFCKGEDGFEVTRDSFEELEEERAADTRLWNYSAHKLRVVQAGNSADGFHLLEGMHDSALLARVRDILTCLPSTPVFASIMTNSERLCVEQLGSFLVATPGGRTAVISVQRCSPLFNYVVAKGSRILLNFDTAERASEDQTATTQWHDVGEVVQVGVADSLLHTSAEISSRSHQHGFQTVEFFEIGDCAVVTGVMETADCAAPPCADALSGVLPFVSGTLITPVLCTMKHNLYGTVGFLAYQCVLSSCYPPTILVCTKIGHAALEPGAADPTATLRFFNASTALFEEHGPSFDEMFERLPFPVNQIDQLEQSGEFACSIKARLLEVVHLSEDHTALVVFSVTECNKTSSTFLSLDVNQTN